MKRKIHIGASCYAGEKIIPLMVPDWDRTDSQSELKVEISDSETIFENVINGDLEVGLIGASLEHEEVETQEFLTNDELILIAPKEHPFNSKKEISINELNGQNFIIREPGSATRMWLRENLSNHGLSLDDLNIVAEMSCHTSILTAVEAGSGVAFIPKGSVKESLSLGRINEIRIKEMSPITGSICLINNREHLTEDGKKVLSFFEKEKNKVTELLAV